MHRRLKKSASLFDASAISAPVDFRHVSHLGPQELTDLPAEQVISAVKQGNPEEGRRASSLRSHRRRSSSVPLKMLQRDEQQRNMIKAERKLKKRSKGKLFGSAASSAASSRASSRDRLESVASSITTASSHAALTPIGAHLAESLNESRPQSMMDMSLYSMHSSIAPVSNLSDISKFASEAVVDSPPVSPLPVMRKDSSSSLSNFADLIGNKNIALDDVYNLIVDTDKDGCHPRLTDLRPDSAPASAPNSPSVGTPVTHL